MEFKDWTIVIATLIGPLFAVQVSQYLERLRRTRDERISVFKTLMATRAAILDRRHVEALNQIDVVFSSQSKNDVAVRNAWKEYLDHLCDKVYPRDAWAARRVEFLVELLQAMAVALDYDFDKTHIKNQAYFPEGYGDMELDQTIIRKAFVEVLSGNKAFPIEVVTRSAA